jgi:hypothetical protein
MGLPSIATAIFDLEFRMDCLSSSCATALRAGGPHRRQLVGGRTSSRDSRDRIWITVSTRVKNWMEALRTDPSDGYLARYENGTFDRADGFRFTNETGSTRMRNSYVAETAGGCITRLRTTGAAPSRIERSSVRRSGKGVWSTASPDRAATGGTLVYSTSSFITPQGDMRVLLDEGDVRKWARSNAFLQNHVAEDVLFATGAASRRDGQRHVWRADLQTVTSVRQGQEDPIPARQCLLPMALERLVFARRSTKNTKVPLVFRGSRGPSWIFVDLRASSPRVRAHLVAEERCQRAARR